jgi:hypothetical protein
LRGRFLEDLEVVVHIEGPVIQHPKPFTRESVLDRLPDRPRKWGPWKEKYRDFSNYVQVPPVQARPASPNSTSFRNSGSVDAVLQCKDLRPWSSHTFTEEDSHRDLVLLTSDLDLTAAHITATATARGIHNRWHTEFIHPIAPQLDLTEKIRQLLNGLHGYYFMAEA